MGVDWIPLGVIDASRRILAVLAAKLSIESDLGASRIRKKCPHERHRTEDETGKARAAGSRNVAALGTSVLLCLLVLGGS
jgi:hypothetical protein